MRAVRTQPRAFCSHAVVALFLKKSQKSLLKLEWLDEKFRRLQKTHQIDDFAGVGGLAGHTNESPTRGEGSRNEPNLIGPGAKRAFGAYAYVITMYSYVITILQVVPPPQPQEVAETQSYVPDNCVRAWPTFTKKSRRVPERLLQSSGTVNLLQTYVLPTFLMFDRGEDDRKGNRCSG